MINKVNNNQIANLLSGVAARQTSPDAAAKGTKADASLQVRYDAVIEQAKQTPVEDADAVARARQLIADGQLETPENIRKAAQNILEFGV